MSLRNYAAATLPDLAMPEVAAHHLADHLNKGELMLLLGAGVSMSSGLPSWETLVKGCEASVGIASAQARGSQELMQAIDKVRRRLDNDGRSGELLDLVRDNLYPSDYLDDGTYPDDIVASPMLIAIGALAMASSRGSVTDVFTFNFDDLLEWYLHLHGFTTQVVSEFPTILRGDRDVVVHHPHGFLPLVAQKYSRTDWLVLAYSELVARLSGADSAWSRLLEDRLQTKLMLAVGTSMNDLDLDVVLRRVRVAVGDRPLGFVLVSAIDEDKRDSLLEQGVVPVQLGSRDAIPKFILEVCRRAAARR